MLRPLIHNAFAVQTPLRERRSWELGSTARRCVPSGGECKRRINNFERLLPVVNNGFPALEVFDEKKECGLHNNTRAAPA